MTKAEAVKGELHAILEDKSLYWLLHAPRVAIIGAPNVGKSTLANRLFAQQRVITADLPGTTRDWVGDWVNLDGLPVHLLDTPGQRDSTDAIEQCAIARSRAEIDRADLVLLVLDPTQPLGPAQAQLRAQHPGAMTIINKSDLKMTWDTHLSPAIRTVATTGVGTDELRSRIRAHFHCADVAIDRPRWWTPRQQEFLRALSPSPTERGPG
jgi:tRNA modification GTPase